MLRKLYDWTMRLSQTPHALWALAAISFIESSVFPVPPHPLLMVMVLARPERWLRIAGVCTAASVLGGMAGYALGAFLFDQVAQPILEFYGKLDQFQEMSAKFNEYGAWAVLVAGLTPFPYKVITIFSGATGLDFGVFCMASLAARGTIFTLISGLLWKFGPPIRGFIEQRLGLVTSLALAVLIGGFAAARWLF